jgi:predicted permease
VTPPRWTRALLRRLAGPAHGEEVLGDLEEAHAARVRHRSRLVASLLTSIEALDMAWALLRERRRAGWSGRGTTSPYRAPSEHSGGSGERRVGSGPRAPRPSWLDVKLGVRMLAKYPGLSVISGVGIAVAVAIGGVAFGAMRTITASELPLPSGDRIVTLQNTTSGGLDQERQTHLHDLATWRADVRTIEALGAYRIVTRNVVTDEGQVTRTRVTEMTASGFRIAGMPPLLGRYLVDEDEERGSPDVLVISHGIWRDRFGEDPGVIGRTLQLGTTPHTIVGIMPPGFAFPINNRVWAPLRLDPLDHPLGDAPAIDVFGRLAPGVSLAEAQVELDVIGARSAALQPTTHGNVRLIVFPFARELSWGALGWFLYVGQVMVSLILVVIAVNVAALVYARTATRSGEILVRTALGASRARIVLQLFAESFVLSVLAAAAGLVVAGWGLGHIAQVVTAIGGEQIPFWWDFRLRASTAVYALGLAVLAAVIIGVVPALGATGKRLRTGLQSVGSGGSGLRLGRLWTALIVFQVAAAVAILPVAIAGARSVLESVRLAPGSSLRRFLVAGVTYAEAPPPDQAETVLADRRAALARVVQELEAEPEIERVIVMEVAPWADPDIRFEVEGGARRAEAGTLELPTAAEGTLVGLSRVGPEFFPTFGARQVAGRALSAGDIATASDVVVVDDVFVERAMGGVDPVGLRIRFADWSERVPGAEPGWTPWHTIVGVVEVHYRRGMARAEAKAYAPMNPEALGPRTWIAARARGDEAASLTGRVREVAAAVDPTLQLGALGTLEAYLTGGSGAIRVFVIALAGLAVSVLLLSVAGLYALMSFTVVQRRREIGIRSALGANAHTVVRGVLTRAIWQLVVGIVAGVAFVGLVDRSVGGEMLGGRASVLLPVVALLMMVVGLLAAWGPAREGLRIQPSEALRSE